MSETSLHYYIQAANSPENHPDITERHHQDNSYEEDGITIISIESEFIFNNGVRLRREYEMEEREPEPGVCAECWIRYEVVEMPPQLMIHPARKHFTNACQESFWLKTMSVRQPVQ